MIIQVIDEDIDKGTHTCESCPIALALRRNLPDKEIKVFPDFFVIDEKYYNWDEDITRWIKMFDSKKFKMDLIEFEIELSDG